MHRRDFIRVTAHAGVALGMTGLAGADDREKTDAASKSSGKPTFRDLGWALLLSVLLVYMILAAQFESFLDPLVISAVLPVGVMGALVTLFLAGHSVNIISLIGLIALLGLTVLVGLLRRARGTIAEQLALAAGERRAFRFALDAPADSPDDSASLRIPLAAKGEPLQPALWIAREPGIAPDA